MNVGLDINVDADFDGDLGLNVADPSLTRGPPVSGCSVAHLSTCIDQVHVQVAVNVQVNAWVEINVRVVTCFAPPVRHICFLHAGGSRLAQIGTLADREEHDPRDDLALQWIDHLHRRSGLLAEELWPLSFHERAPPRAHTATVVR